jgi:hypothetical protein
MENAHNSSLVCRSQAGQSVFELCTQHWQGTLSPSTTTTGQPQAQATAEGAEGSGAKRVDSTQFFGLLSDLQATTPSVREPLLALFVQYLMDVPPVRKSPFFGVFPMFVPSLSWSNQRFYM